MIVQIQIPDAVAQLYQDQATRGHLTLERVLARQLIKFAEVPGAAQTVVLHGDALAEIDRLLGIGSTQSPAAVLRAIKSWAGITIGAIRLDFSPAQLDEIAHRAAKQGKTPEAVVADIVAQLQSSFFHEPVVAR